MARPEPKDSARQPTSDSDAAAAAASPDLRVGAVRYAGYANEVGESFRPLVARTLVHATYGVAGCYVLADAAFRSRDASRRGDSAAVEAGDTIMWQGLASVAIPGFVINRIVWAAGQLPLQSSPAGRKWLPTLTGLACIPLIVHPIDVAVDRMMDTLVRPLYPRGGSGS